MSFAARTCFDPNFEHRQWSAMSGKGRSAGSPSPPSRSRPWTRLQPVCCRSRTSPCRKFYAPPSVARIFPSNLSGADCIFSLISLLLCALDITSLSSRSHFITSSNDRVLFAITVPASVSKRQLQDSLPPSLNLRVHNALHRSPSLIFMNVDISYHNVRTLLNCLDKLHRPIS